MKTIFILKIKFIKLLVLFLLLPSFGVAGGGLKAQTSDDLLNSEWTLIESSINELNLSIIGAFLYPDIFGDYSFEFNYGTVNCIESFKVNLTDVTESSFNLSPIFDYDSCDYTDPDVIEAVTLIQSFYFELPFDLNSTPKNPFTYEWVDASPFADELRITNNQGDWLLYQTYTLSTPTFHQNSFTIYPNPVKENLSINNTSNQSVSAIIYDVTGKLLQSHTLEANTSSINVKTLKAGLYFVVFENENGEKVSKKFVKR